MDGTGFPLGVMARVKSWPPTAANSDWIVRRKTENLKRSLDSP
jgi:hypothetical protein